MMFRKLAVTLALTAVATTAFAAGTACHDFTPMIGDVGAGLPVGAAFTNPDNLAIDSKSNINIVEDQPGGVQDTWFAIDADNDGVAEAVGRWASLSTVGVEATGLYFDPFRPNVAYVNVQQPASRVDRTIMISTPCPCFKKDKDDDDDERRGRH